MLSLSLSPPAPGDQVNIRHRQPTPSFFSDDDSDGSDIESCFNIKDDQEETDADTEPTDVGTDVDGYNKADLAWTAREDNVDTEPIDVDPDIDGCDEADLAWIVKNNNAHPLEYYLNQKNDSDKSEDKGEDYSDGSILLDRIEAQFYQYIFYSFLFAIFCSNVNRGVTRRIF